MFLLITGISRYTVGEVYLLFIASDTTEYRKLENMNMSVKLQSVTKYLCQTTFSSTWGPLSPTINVTAMTIQPACWKSAKSYIFENYGATVNFASSSNMYVGAYRYVTKSDKMLFIGNFLKKHPDLEIIPTTYSRAILAKATFPKNRLRLNEHSHQTKKPKPEKIKKSDVALFIVNNSIKDELKLMVATTKRR